MTFDEWLDEKFGFAGVRMYRLMDNIDSPDPKYNDLILKWLKAAYDVGYEQGYDVGSAGQPWLRTYDGKLK